MEQKKLTGPQSGVLKYDLLTALAATGLHGSPTFQMSMARLGVMITARYNWRLNEVSIGQAELASLWGVNTRTVKREMKRLLEMGVIICTRPGVRGRVGAYRLNFQRIYQLTETIWPAIGSDFVARMSEMAGSSTVVKVDFTTKQPTQVIKPARPGSWASVLHRLEQLNPGLHSSWFSKLEKQSLNDDTLTLLAPNRFVAGYISTHLAQTLQDAVALEFERMIYVKIVAPA